MPAVKIEHELDINSELPDDVQKIANEQGEREETKSQTIADFRTYVQEHQQCQPHRMDDDHLQKFLRARYWNIRASHDLICHYYKFLEENKSYYEKVHPLDLKQIGDRNLLAVTPYRDQHGHRILIYRFGAWKPSEISVDDLFRATVVLIELGSLEPIAQVLGAVVIFDLEGLSLNHIFHLSPSVAQKMIALLVTSMPVRTTALHIVHQNWAFNAAYNMFKPFMNASMRERLFIHGSDMSSLHRYISPNHLPKRYGGYHEEYPYTLWFENLLSSTTGLKVKKDLEQLGFIFDDAK